MSASVSDRVTPLPVATRSAPPRASTSDSEALAEKRLLTISAPNQVKNAYNTVRARVLSHVAATGDRRVAVVSPVSGDGKSLTAANVAISVARDLSFDAALLDFDLHRPSVASLFDLEVTKGVDDFLAGEALALDQLGYATPFHGLTVFPVRRPRARASELVASERAIKLVDELIAADPNRVLLIDLPPLLATPDAQLLASRCGGALMVVRDGQTPGDTIVRAVELLSDVPIVGAVLNQSDDVATHYYAY